MPRSSQATPLQDRLKACMRDGNLTVADLAHWLDRRDPTVRTWVNGGHMQGGAADMAAVCSDLTLLEKLIKKKRGFPVPRISLRERKAYLEKVYKEGIRA